MGWLFAVSLALQEQRERALWQALPPIALGHLLALAAVALPLILLAMQVPHAWLARGAAALLLGFGGWRLFRWYRHPRWVGMKVSSCDLVLWSFLMATGHGAGLMIAPVLVSLGGEALAGVAAHTGAMLVVMAGVAWVIYRWVGLAILRTHWINFDLIWAMALLLTGAIALVMSP